MKYYSAILPETLYSKTSTQRWMNNSFLNEYLSQNPDKEYAVTLVCGNILIQDILFILFGNHLFF